MKKANHLILVLGFAMLGVLGCTESVEESGLVEVRVTLPQNAPEDDKSRTLSAAVAQGRLNYWEVVFMDKTSKACYSGTTDGYNALTVALPPSTYGVLLLAGEYQGPGIYVLMATGYIANQTISAAAANTIDFSLPANKYGAIAFDPGLAANNFKATYSTYNTATGSSSTNRATNAPAGTIPTIEIPLSSDANWDSTNSGLDNTYTVNATLTLTNLLTARTDAAVSTDLFFKKDLYLRSISNPPATFDSINPHGTDPKKGFVAQDTTHNDSGTPKTATIEFKIANKSTAAKYMMPNTNSMGSLYFELRYYAFSFASPKTATPWRIRAGADYRLDVKGVNDSGGAILVKIGAGAPYSYSAGNQIIEIQTP